MPKLAPESYYGRVAAFHKGRRRASRGGIGPVRILLCLAAGAAFALAIAMMILFEGGKPPSKASGPAPAGPTTTAWPYGLPEYQVAVPEGYEGLLPESPDGESPQAGVEDAAVIPGSGTAGARSGAAPGAASGAVPGSAPRPAALRPVAPPPKKEPAGTKSAAKIPAISPETAAARREAKADTYIARTMRQRGAGQAGPPPALIFVIDDVGYNLEQLGEFLALPFPLTVAVLPRLDKSAEAARLASAAGKEVILHQPMEALGGEDPGPGAIRLGMSGGKIAETTRANLEEMPQVSGINNHMGSAVTRSEDALEPVLELAKSRGIYYLDSLTAPDTATAVLCRQYSMPYWERDVFLDNSGDRQSILNALEEGKKIARSRGASVMIGHVWSAELAQTLMDIYPRLVQEGYTLSTISRFMMMQASTGENADVRPGN